MISMNQHYAELKDSYLFYNIAQKIKAYQSVHPSAHLYRMGIGDVLCRFVMRSSVPCMKQLTTRQMRKLSWIYAGMRRSFFKRSHCKLLR